VTHGDAVDTIISTLDEPPYAERMTADGISFRGRLAVIRQVGGEVVAAWLFCCESLRVGEWKMASLAAQYRGEIVAATRKADGDREDALITDAKLPYGRTLHGVWIIVTHGNGFTHGYEIDHIEKRDGKIVIVLTMDHGLRIDGRETREVFFPLRKIKGKNAFAIPLASAMSHDRQN